jgi:hypothetical protein
MMLDYNLQFGDAIAILFTVRPVRSAGMKEAKTRAKNDKVPLESSNL